MCRCFLYKDLIGSALPSVPNDQLDSTTTDVPGKNGKEVVGVSASSSEGSGIGLLSKLIFFGLIVAMVMVFLKSRKSPLEKSLA